MYHLVHKIEDMKNEKEKVPLLTKSYPNVTVRLKKVKSKNVLTKLTIKNKLTLKSVMDSWEELYVIQKTNEHATQLQKFVNYFKSIKVANILVQKNMEQILVDKYKASHLHLLYSKNEIIKKYYNEVKNGIEKDFKRLFSTLKEIEHHDIFIKFIQDNIQVIAFTFFEGMAYCVKNNNMYLNTLYSQINLAIKMSFMNSKYSYTRKCPTCGLNVYNLYKDLNSSKINNILNTKIVKLDHKLYEYTTKSVMNAAETAQIFIKIKIDQLNDKNIQEKRNMLNGFKLNESLNTYLNRMVFDIVFKPPMVVAPKPWRKHKKNIMQYEGGYYNNKFLKLNIEYDKSIKFNNKFFEAINYTQSVPMSINKPYLKWLLEQELDIILAQFTNITLNNLQAYCSKDFSSLSIDIINTLNEIASTLYMAKLFSSIPKIYIPMHYDFRGRLYCSSYPLHFYTSDIFRGLYVFYEHNIKIKYNDVYTFLKYSSSDSKTFTTVFNNKIEDYNFKDFFLFKSILLNCNNSMVGVDASSSTFQIQGVLMKDNLMLKLSNVIASDTKKDIYKYIMKKFYDKIIIEKNILQKHYEKINEIHYKKFNIKIWSSYEEFYDFINNLMQNRQIWKALIMRLGYNQMRKSRAIQLNEFICDLYYKNLNYYNIGFNQFTWYLATELENIFYIIFPKQRILKQFFAKAASLTSKHNANVKFAISTYIKYNSHTVWQAYHKKKWHEVFYYSKFSKKKYHIVYALDDYDSIDIPKMRISTLPNYIQYLDSIILVQVILKCKKNKIPIKTIHDNFLVHQNYISSVKEYYIESIVSTLFQKDKDPLYIFLVENNLDYNYDMLKLYYEIMEPYIELHFMDEKNNIVKQDIIKKKYLEKYRYEIHYNIQYDKFREKIENYYNDFILSW